MKKKQAKGLNTFKLRIVLLIALSSIVAMTLLLYLVLFPQYQRDLEYAKQSHILQVQPEVARVQKILNKPFEQTRQTVALFKQYASFDENTRRQLFSDILVQNLNENSNITACWTIWEPNSIDRLDSLYRNVNLGISGRFMDTYYRIDKEIKQKHELFLNEDELYYSDYYVLPQKSRSSVLLPPYSFSYTDNKFDQINIISAITPITQGYRFLGVVGIDLNLDFLQAQVKTVYKKNNNAFAMLITSKGEITSHPESENIGKKIQQVYPQLVLGNQLLQQISEKKTITFTDNLAGEQTFVHLSPIDIQAAEKQHWFYVSFTPVSLLSEQASSNFAHTVYYFLLTLVLIFTAVWYAAGRVSKPLEKITQVLELLAQGSFNTEKLKKLRLTKGSEMAHIANLVEKIIDGLKETAIFTSSIGAGKLQTTFEPLSTNDQLRIELISLKEKLKEERQKEEAYKTQEAYRKWKIEGIAKFSSILRTNISDINELADIVLTNIIEYVDAQVGGIFVMNQISGNQTHLKLAASYAYDRKKYYEKTIALGEGLVGACALEKKTIVLKKIPADYITISTGLGKQIPNSLVVVPLMQNQQVVGVLELASLELLAQHKVEFLEELAASITSTFITVRVSNQTSELLLKTQQQSEELRAQEEEMRQNLEEMRATQEVSQNRQLQLEGLMEALNSSALVAEFTPDGTLEKINESFTELLGVHSQQVIGNKAHEIAPISVEKWQSHQAFWNKLAKGERKSSNQEIRLSDINSIWINSVFSPILNMDGNVEKIIQIATDITPYKLIENQLKEKLKQLDKQNEAHKTEKNNILHELENTKLKMEQAQIQLSDKTQQIVMLTDELNQLKNTKNLD